MQAAVRRGRGFLARMCALRLLGETLAAGRVPAASHRLHASPAASVIYSWSKQRRMLLRWLARIRQEARRNSEACVASCYMRQ